MAVSSATIALEEAKEKGGSGGVSLLLRKEVATETPEVAAKSLFFHLMFNDTQKQAFMRTNPLLSSPQKLKEIPISLSGVVVTTSLLLFCPLVKSPAFAILN